MNKKNKEILIPWMKHGVPWYCSQNIDKISYYDWTKRQYLRDEPIEWKPNKPFKAAFNIKHFTGSTDSTQVIIQHTETEQTFYIRDADFLEVLKKTTCVYGVILGEWKFKRTVGKYYGLKLVV